MTLLKKMVFYIRTEGAGKTVARTVDWLFCKAKRLPVRWKERIHRKKYVDQIIAHVKGREVYLLSYSFDWNTPLFQRPHQLAAALAKRKNTHVIFASDQYRFDNFPGFITVAPHLDVVPLRFLLKEPKIFSGAERVTIFKSLPIQMEILERIPYDTLIYDYIDDLSVVPFLTGEMEDIHRELIKMADLTVCTAKALYEDALLYTERAVLSPNAGDYSFFHDNRNCACDKTVAKQVERYSCVLGYYGCLAEWLDYDLVIKVAKERPDWCFLLIGECFDHSARSLKECGLDNILLWPAQPYKTLPSFIAAFDIQTIPFLVNQITEGTSPVKLFEYMATGKPILTSAMPECMQYHSVEIYHTAEEFIAKTERFLTISPEAEYFKEMEREAKENTWAHRVCEILDRVKGCAENKQ